MEKEIIYLSKDEFNILLDVLNFRIDEQGRILDQNGEKVICPFTQKQVELDTLSIMPGSLILMNTSPLTLSEYFYQYPDD